MNIVSQKYANQIELTVAERDKHAKKEQYLPFLRLFAFLAMVFLFYKFLRSGDILFVYSSAVFLILFLMLVKWNNQLRQKIEHCDQLIRICTDEINALNYDFSSFEPGNEFVDPEHPYSYDLDIFGERSLFHSINRSVTIFGKNRLAEYFKNSFNFRESIDERQKAILELSVDQDFRQQMMLIFYGIKSKENDRTDFIEWVDSENTMVRNRMVNYIRFILPVLTNASIILSFMNLVVYQIPLLMVIIQLFVIQRFGMKTIKVHSLLTGKVEIISKYARLLSLIEKTNLRSPLLAELQEQLSFKGEKAPSRIIRQLSQLLNWMDNNLNVVVGFVLNGLFLFNLHLLVAVEKWKITYRDVVPKWFDAMGEIDALASLANFTANNPEYVFPDPVTDQFNFEASNLGHPLIPKSECVTNNISISRWNQYCIVTGANMSGKSTFLRTVGTNYVLAMIGAPVFASRFTFYPILLHSSIRTSDSLARKESFFYSELRRLKQIITELESGQQTFILLDEILKGTNSKDKQAGSIALLEQLIKYQSVGLIATHDLSLGDLIRQYPDNIQNLCFEIQIIDDQMSIDYKLQEGVCQNLNATFLMKKMGILIK